MITAIVPCLNEEKTINSVINELREVLGKKAQIIVVDNGSTDNTFRRAQNSGVEVYREPNRGKGYAFRTGLNKVNLESKAIVLVDGDNTYSLDNLQAHIDQVLLDGFDMVVGNRVIQYLQSKPFLDGHRM
jgi:glycosyltransferase involved in cell wall biosynthesis